ncbi:hypothetical protein I7I50_07570 [Histoplasma capsulatum G186AR]|uniref:Tat pathway signal sequence n=1 Tax=Ajellomyces capsulatus TaxID=5037 RepID=A0A8H8D2G5_AJECA|nr:hypothetical protein I7I52_09359 [Histoplasma capsulatum]QSS68230.1 hypothetical protein I7I50_07570 [Histoplasma capsulatum G186AR]
MFKTDPFPTKPKKRYFPHGLSGCALFSVILCAIISLWGAYLIGSSRYHLDNGNRGKSPIPTLPFLKEPVVFNPDPRWSGSDALTHKHWEKEHLNGFTHSFVLDNPRDYGLEEGIPSRKGFERFGISMYHQLHCLASIRMAYFNQTDNYQHRRDEVDMKMLGHLHVDHCFDYLRQAIRCSADPTLEWGRAERNGKPVEIDGWGVPHRICKDVSVFEEFIAQHQ